MYVLLNSLVRCPNLSCPPRLSSRFRLAKYRMCIVSGLMQYDIYLFPLSLSLFGLVVVDWDSDLKEGVSMYVPRGLGDCGLVLEGTAMGFGARMHFELATGLRSTPIASLESILRFMESPEVTVSPAVPASRSLFTVWRSGGVCPRSFQGVGSAGERALATNEQHEPLTIVPTSMLIGLWEDIYSFWGIQILVKLCKAQAKTSAVREILNQSRSNLLFHFASGVHPARNTGDPRSAEPDAVAVKILRRFVLIAFGKAQCTRDRDSSGWDVWRYLDTCAVAAIGGWAESPSRVLCRFGILWKDWGVRLWVVCATLTARILQPEGDLGLSFPSAFLNLTARGILMDLCAIPSKSRTELKEMIFVRRLSSCCYFRRVWHNDGGRESFSTVSAAVLKGIGNITMTSSPFDDCAPDDSDTYHSVLETRMLLFCGLHLWAVARTVGELLTKSLYAMNRKGLGEKILLYRILVRKEFEKDGQFNPAGLFGVPVVALALASRLDWRLMLAHAQGRLRFGSD
ncbi:hypothetical protein FA15DRAFT_736270 [Coprinopsis marcescibilis]|uniref:Uncharacterized protein n=1 Tax=Coprinopsis marcescibilis TaxID=230819 RepID=A0A5C3L9K7_COPMA|nr:hypothetical protein FA15DRAFT_736270 [Coprinopsis marcescibilis]